MNPGNSVDRMTETWFTEYMETTAAPTATPTGTYTHMTLCAHCGETVERQWTPIQRQNLAAYRHIRTLAQAEVLGILSPAGRWVHFQAGEVWCGG